VKRFAGDNQLAADACVAREEMGKIILLRNRVTQVVRGNQAQAERRFTERQSLHLLQLQYPLDVPNTELSVFREYAADAAVVMRKNAPRPFDRQDIFLGFHRHSARAR